MIDKDLLPLFKCIICISLGNSIIFGTMILLVFDNLIGLFLIITSPIALVFCVYYWIIKDEKI